jgi:hypothetical protein
MTFTNMYYAEFDTTQANLLADLRTHILSSASWARPNAGSKPDTYKATTTRGADMVFDLSDAAITVNNLTIGVWRSYDGTTFVDKINRYLWWRNSGGATTNVLHCVVSVSKEHVYISVEGPRSTEASPETANLGSTRTAFFMCDMVPYHAGDTTPTIFCGGHVISNSTSTSLNPGPLGNLRRDYANVLSWPVCRLVTLTFPVCNTLGNSDHSFNSQRLAVGDGKYYLYPYVCVADVDGLRGRLAAFFYAGMTANGLGTAEVNSPALGSKVTYDGQLYKLLAPTRAGNAGINTWNQFGYVANSGSAQYNLAVAVPCT